MKILITRPRSQSAGFGAALQQSGFEPVYFPVIEIRPMEDLSALSGALENIASYEWVIFTSVNGVEVVFDHLTRLGELNTFHAACSALHTKFAAIGPKTSEALRQRGFEPFFVPDEFVAEALLPGLGDLRGRRVLLPGAEIARKTLPEGIVASGGSADEIAVYHTLPAEPDPAGLRALQAGVDWLSFTSPSSVQNFVRILRDHGMDPLKLPRSPKTACIGPITAQAARAEGFRVDVVAGEYTTEGLIKTISNF